jgi:ankyrin repeat protein
MGYNMNGGDSELFMAIRNNDLIVIKNLVNSGVDINNDEYCSLSVLGYAVVNGNDDICKYLIDAGAIFNKGENIIAHIIRHYEFYNIDTLRRAIYVGADVNLPDRHGNSLLTLANEIPNTVYNYNLSMNRLAVNNSKDVFEMLIKNGATININ